RVDDTTLPLPPANDRIKARHPAVVVLVNENGHVAQRVAPLHYAAEHMRMRDHDGGKPAGLLDVMNRIRIQIAKAVPENISGGAGNEKNLRTDGENGIGDDSGYAVAQRRKNVAVSPHFAERSPALRLVRHGLAFIAAVQTTLGKRGVGIVLQSTVHADVAV